jgi:hypothetical protein
MNLEKGTLIYLASIKKIINKDLFYVKVNIFFLFYEYR